MADISEVLREDFKDAESAEVYAESFLDTYIATQIRVLREQNEMTQAQLAALLGTSQTVISRIENVNYSAWNIGTLKKVARAFKVRLHVSFETFGSLIDDVQRFNRKSLERAPRDTDPILFKAQTAFGGIRSMSMPAAWTFPQVARTSSLNMVSFASVSVDAGWLPAKSAIADPIETAATEGTLELSVSLTEGLRMGDTVVATLKQQTLIPGAAALGLTDGTPTLARTSQSVSTGAGAAANSQLALVA